MKIKIGILSKNKFVETILKQEGISFENISNENLSDLEKFTIIITDYNQPEMINLLVLNFKKEVLIISKSYFLYKSKDLSQNAKLLKIRKSLRNLYTGNPNLDVIFGETCYIDLNENSELNNDFRILRIKDDYNNFYILPIELDISIFSDENCRKCFFDKRKELPSEIVSASYNFEIREIILQSINLIFSYLGIPLIHKSYIPNESLFIFRIDTDFCSMEEAEKLYELCKKYNIKATWFLDTSNVKIIKEIYSSMCDQELGLHCNRHIIFKDYDENFRNIQSGLSILRKYGIKPKGFASPFGEWNESLQKAIEESGFEYSSEFSYDYDNIPSFPSSSNVLQIPIHPISCGRLRRSHYSDAEKVNYYRRVIDEKISKNEPVILYHHPHHKMLNVIEEIFKYSKQKEMQNMSLHAYNTWWKKRDKEPLEYSMNTDKFFLSKKPSIPLAIEFKGKRVICKFSKSVKYHDLNWQKYPFFRMNNPKKQKKMHWRNWLYNFEHWRGKRRL